MYQSISLWEREMITLSFDDSFFTSQCIKFVECMDDSVVRKSFKVSRSYCTIKFNVNGGTNPFVVHRWKLDSIVVLRDDKVPEMENDRANRGRAKEKRGREREKKKRILIRKKQLWETDLPFHKSLTRIVIHAEVFLNNARSFIDVYFLSENFTFDGFPVFLKGYVPSIG